MASSPVNVELKELLEDIRKFGVDSISNIKDDAVLGKDYALFDIVLDIIDSIEDKYGN